MSSDATKTRETGSHSPSRGGTGGCDGIPPAGVSSDRAGDVEAQPPRDVGGRPSKYDPAYCLDVVSCCSKGLSLTAFCASIGVARRTLLNWAEQHPEFAEAVDVAKASACAWWEDRARTVGAGRGGPGAAAMVQFMLKNFGETDFSDKREVTYSGAIQHSLTYEQAIEEARRRGLPERVLIAESPE